MTGHETLAAMGVCTELTREVPREALSIFHFSFRARAEARTPSKRSSPIGTNATPLALARQSVVRPSAKEPLIVLFISLSLLATSRP